MFLWSKDYAPLPRLRRQLRRHLPILSALRPGQAGASVDQPAVDAVMIPDLDEVRRFAANLHARGRAWSGEAFGWPAEYNPERPEPPLDSKMTFTPADFCIGESGIWFFSLMWEHGKDARPVEFLDDRNVVRVLAEPRAPYEIVDSTDERSS